MNRISNQFSSIEQLTDQYLKTSSTTSTSNDTSKLSFEDVLKQKTIEQSTDLKFSKHASARLGQRNIDLTTEQSERLSNGVRAAANKGVNDSLVVVDDLAFIVNVPSKTVVTAMDQSETNSNVFTNIDGAVIM